jgi:hypothetical protein
MNIKSDGEIPTEETIKKFKPIRIFFFSVGLILMLIAILSPWVHGILAFLLFLIGWQMMDDQYNKLLDMKNA